MTGRQVSARIWAHQDSNLEPTGYEPVALTVELWARTRAGDGNRTRIFGLEGQGSTIKQHPPVCETRHAVCVKTLTFGIIAHRRD